MAADVARREGIVESGYRVLTNNGPDAGQTVFHAHFHLIPKWSEQEGFRYTWKTDGGFDQQESYLQIKQALNAVTKKDVQVAVTVDPSIIGGLVVKLGSRMVDTSLRTRLNMIKHAMKEVS